MHRSTSSTPLKMGYTSKRLGLKEYFGEEQKDGGMRDSTSNFRKGAATDRPPLAKHRPFLLQTDHPCTACIT